MSLVIVGANGFLGRTLIARGDFPLPVKAVARITPPDVNELESAVTWIKADLTMPTSVDSVLEANDVVLNLAYMPKAGKEDNVRLMQHLIEACLRRRVARLVHCSTANVIGATNASTVVETTPCLPVTLYEQTKWTLEQLVLGAVSRGLDTVILRPTVIVGPGGQNLVSLARSLRRENSVISYLRACLFDRRPMHLVPARDVAAALLHVALLPGTLRGEIYFASADDDPSNNFQAVEAILSEVLGLRSRKLPPVFLPRGLLSLLLRMRGRSEWKPNRVYGSEKLRSTGFRPQDSVASAVRAFGESIRQNLESQPGIT